MNGKLYASLLCPKYPLTSAFNIYTVIHEVAELKSHKVL